MENWQIIALIILGVIVTGIVTALVLKRKGTNESKATTGTDVPDYRERTAPTLDIPPLHDAAQSLETTKSKMGEKVSERHAEAARIIQEAVANIADNSQERKTRNESKLEKLGEDLKDL